MPHDPALVAEARGWLSKTGKDLAAAQYELKADPPGGAAHRVCAEIPLSGRSRGGDRRGGRNGVGDGAGGLCFRAGAPAARSVPIAHRCSLAVSHVGVVVGTQSARAVLYE
jgi:hypothetical protein